MLTKKYICFIYIYTGCLYASKNRDLKIELWYSNMLFAFMVLQRKKREAWTGKQGCQQWKKTLQKEKSRGQKERGKKSRSENETIKSWKKRSLGKKLTL